MADDTTQTQPAQRFGTFLGVYTPSVLTILGVMMYLRFGWVIGNLGLPLTLLAVLMASSITFITGLSASAISTNMRVGVGGEYYMVSRSLGLELGGAIGIPLFMCRTLSLTLYCFGLSESIAPFWPATWGEPPVQLMTAAFIVLTTAIAGKSASISLKLQLPIMIAVGLSVLVLAGGALSGDLASPEMTPHYERSAEAGFWFVFAVFFPAVTGFTAGIGMSGDLKDPQRSIPRGTILAVLTGTTVYLGVMVLLATSGKVTGVDLATLDPNAPPVWTKIAWFGMILIYPGLWGAILSSAFGSALGGPRVLQALALDGLAPRAIGRTSKTGQPTIATWVTGAIALAAVALGDLNAVGRWVTIFFLTLYVIINLSAALETLVGDTSYRPTIKVPWFVSLAGSCGAVVVMFLISPLACASAIVLELLLYTYLRSRSLKSGWGDVRAGLWSALARFALLNLRKSKTDARNWRPNILLFTANPAVRIGLVRMANWFNQNRGVLTVCQAIEGDLEKDMDQVPERLAEMDATAEAEGLTAFNEVHVVRRFEDGILAITQANGFAGLQSNTVMFGWATDAERRQRLLRMVRAITDIKRNAILARLPNPEGPRHHGAIHVWWRGMRDNGDLMLLLAYLLNLNPEWRRATVSVRTIVESETDRVEMTQQLDAMISEARIRADSEVIVRPEGKTPTEIIHESSRDADVVFLGLPIPSPDTEVEIAERLNDLVE
ncbi:MAG: amino acid permease, partial [Deltaproteobacteria bacterium]|nr:amino acid permease [Deltaproteobacteria bacterium]